MSKRTNKHEEKADRNYPFKNCLSPTAKFKKAPNAPRRFKSSYMFFSTQKHKEIREKRIKEGENAKQLATTEVAKMVSQAWKELSEEERGKWEEIARKDKSRYEMEKSMYQGPWKVPVSAKGEIDPTKPKRPMSAFLSYSNRKRMEVKEKYKNAKTADISRILAQMWKDAPPEEKKEFIDEEFRLRQDYKVAMAAWKERTSEEFKKQREKRENEAMKLVLEGKLPPDPFTPTPVTSLPTVAAYDNQHLVDNSGQRKSSTDDDVAWFHPPRNSYYLRDDTNFSDSSAAFQPPPGRRSVDSNPYTYGAYVQSHPFHGYYRPSLYPEHTPQMHFHNAQPGYAPEESVPLDPQHYSSYYPYHQFDPNSPYYYPHHPS
ncbi:HMG high mobility group box-containing protein [Nitzschia inconspicua]|uniref:HMG high mobility group box-containing protein n=1 Tax=Nitzschia inconspicua TaxID=303405 RepID=A0A9K3K8W0_9STRA|nr:HMG high mobility group box-containing protein [Nitzschia inconspicua]KAG7371514.1 HMG high mobility group box-containing protein [Nitzschia inconspicua]